MTEMRTMSTEIRTVTIDEFFCALAARRATPAGGSAAAVTAGQAAALLAMCARYAEAAGTAEDRGTARALVSTGETQMRQLIDLADEDSRAFSAVMAAKRLPSATASEQAARKAALADGYRAAVRVPLHCAQVCLDLLRMARVLAPLCTGSLLGDALASLTLAYAALECSLNNVRINLRAMDDAEFVAAATATADDLARQAAANRAAAAAHFRERLGFSTTSTEPAGGPQ